MESAWPFIHQIFIIGEIAAAFLVAVGFAYHAVLLALRFLRSIGD